MTDLIDKIRKASEFDTENIINSARGELVSYHSEDEAIAFALGARYQHAQNVWAFEALEEAIGFISVLANSEADIGETNIQAAAIKKLNKIAALVPKGEK